MSHHFNCRTLIWASLLALVFPGANAFAQYPYNYPYYPGYYNPYGNIGPGFFLQGTASVISAVGNLYIQQEQARIVREQANQARLDTRRKAFDQMMYEKANTPTFTETEKYKKDLLTQRLMNNPVSAEINRGETLNAMMPLAASLSAKGVPGPPIQLDAYILKHINVTTGKGVGNLGMLKDGGRLDWPIPLQGPKQEKLAALLPRAVSEAAMGKLQPKLYREVTSNLTALEEELRQKFRKEEIDGGSYLVGKRFLDSLEDAVKGLQQPGSRQVLNGSYAARGGNVQELVDNMTKEGLRFAPASPGDEAAYRALHNALVSYTSTLQTAAGFQVRYNPPRTDPFVNRPQPFASFPQ